MRSNRKRTAILMALLMTAFSAVSCGSTDTGKNTSSRSQDGIVIGAATDTPAAATTETPGTPTDGSGADTPAVTEDPQATENPEPSEAPENTESPTPGEGSEPSVTLKPTSTNENPVTISFTGDVFLSREIYATYQTKGLGGAFSQKVQDVFKDSDLMVVNHEYCSSDLDASHAVTYQTWIEQAPTITDTLYPLLGVDMVGLANNHAFDYGAEGFEETLSNLEKLEIPYVGAGRNIEEATAVKTLDAGGKRFALCAANAVITDQSWVAGENKAGMASLHPWHNTYPKLLENITKAKADPNNDIVIAMLHIGNEKTTDLAETQIMYAHAAIDAGADIVIGSHAHNLQGIEYYGNGVIFYNLGNFLFSSYYRATAIITVMLNPDNTYELKIHPCKTQNLYTEYADDGGKEVYDFFNKYSVNAKVDENGMVTKKG